MANLSVEKVAAALRAHNGIILKAAAACGVGRPTLYKFIKEHPELEDVRNECNEELLDVAESNITKALNEAELKTTRWFLERKGKDRGYTTRSEVTGADGEPLQTQTIERRIVDPAAE